MASLASYVADARQALLRHLGRHAEGCSEQLVDLYALLVLVKGAACGLRDIHDAWAISTERARPEHAALVPFDQLAPDVQALDEPFRTAVVSTALELD